MRWIARIAALVALGVAAQPACSAPQARANAAVEVPAGPDATVVTAEEAEAPRPAATAASPESNGPAPPDAASVARDVAVFRRWLLDQSVGRHVTIVVFSPLPADEQGSAVVQLTLRGTADELVSLGRALDAYYPGASWRALGHERLGESPLTLQIDVEVGLPSGATPRPRCIWDPATPCPADR